MRRRFGIPLTFALLLGVYMAQSISPVEPYYIVAALLAVWAAVDSFRLKVSEHTSSVLASPVGILVWMAVAWPIALPWYLKVHYLVANGESLDKAGGTASIRLALYGFFAILVIGGVAALTFFPQLKNVFLFTKELSDQFGGGVNVNANTKGELILTLDQDRPDDAVANERFARRVAMFARTHYVGADSLKSIEVVLKEVHTVGPATVSQTHGRYKWTLAELSGRTTQPQLASRASATTGKPTSTPSVTAPRQPNTASVVPAGAPAASRAAPSRKPVATHAFARLQAADPTVSWAADSAVVADIDCDGIADTVVVGRKRGELHVGFARAANPDVQILVFDVGRNAKNAVCGVRAGVTLESLDWDPAERGLAKLEGFRRSATCKGVGLGDGDCTPAHIFWSYSTRHVEWYQR